MNKTQRGPKFNSLPIPGKLLYGAGPSQPFSEVAARRGMLAPSHTSELAVRVCQELGEMSRFLFGTTNKHTTVLPFGGTGAIESLLQAMVRPDSNVVVPETGLFSERLVQMATLAGTKPHLVPHAVGEEINVERVAGALNGLGRDDMLAFVLDETSRGTVADATALVRVAEEAGVCVLIDAVTSFPGEHIQVDKLGAGDKPPRVPLAVISCGQKRIGGAPNTAPVTVNDAAWERVRGSTLKTWLFDLPTMLEKLEKRAYHTTTDVNGLVATHEAMRLLLEDCDHNLERLFVQQHAASELFEDVVRALTADWKSAHPVLRWVFPHAPRSTSLKVLTIAENETLVPSILTRLERNHRIEVSPGAVTLPKASEPTPYMRIGLLSPVTRQRTTMLRLFLALYHELNEHGVACEFGPVAKLFSEH